MIKKYSSPAEQALMEIYRTDETPSIESYIYEILKMQDILENSYGKKDLGFCNIVGGGFYGNLGDIVVDRINNPSRIFGVSMGNGILKNHLNDQDKYRINKLDVINKDVL